MPLIIDTYNVLHVEGVLPPDLAGIDIEGLIELIGQSRYARQELALICDGRPKKPIDHPVGQRIRVIAAGRDQDADAVIVRLVRASSTPRRLTVVTSDRRLATLVRRRKCNTIRSEDFLATLAMDADRATGSRGVKPAPPLSEKQVRDWARAFGLSDADWLVPSSKAARHPPPDMQLDAEEMQSIERIDMHDWLPED